MRFLQFFSLFAVLAGCGLDFRIADQDRDGSKDPETDVTVEPKPLIVTSEENPRAYNELTVAKVSTLEGAFDFRAEQATEVSLWIVKFSAPKCGGLQGISPEFRWAEVLADGTLGEKTKVRPQATHVLAAAKTHRLTVEVDAPFGYCDLVQLRFEAHARGL